MKPNKTVSSMELIVSSVLQAGVIISSVIILAGLFLFFLHDKQSGSYHQFTRAGYLFPHNLANLIAAVKSGSGVGLIDLGVLILILTPVLRVATSILLFLRRKDPPMTVVTLFVLLILIGSFILGLTTR